MLHLDWFDTVDLRLLHLVTAILGVFLSIYVMQLWGSGEFRNSHEQPWLVNLRRGALGGVALAFLWSLSYADAKAWQPWPPNVATALFIDLFLLTQVVSSIYKRWNRVQRGLSATAPPP